MASNMWARTPSWGLSFSKDLSSYSFIIGGPLIQTFLIFPAYGDSYSSTNFSSQISPLNPSQRLLIRTVSLKLFSPSFLDTF